jgi:hypothetical protein
MSPPRVVLVGPGVDTRPDEPHAPISETRAKHHTSRRMPTWTPLELPGFHTAVHSGTDRVRGEAYPITCSYGVAGLARDRREDACAPLPALRGDRR